MSSVTPHRPVVGRADHQRGPQLVPPFARESATHKARIAENAWNSRDADRVCMAYSVDSRWRNRDEFIVGREQIRQFLHRKWSNKLDYHLVKELWSFDDSRTAVRFHYEWRRENDDWYRAYGNENWEFDSDDLTSWRQASINDVGITASDRRFHWPDGESRPPDPPDSPTWPCKGARENTPQVAHTLRSSEAPQRADRQ